MMASVLIDYLSKFSLQNGPKPQAKKEFILGIFRHRRSPYTQTKNYEFSSLFLYVGIPLSLFILLLYTASGSALISACPLEAVSGKGIVGSVH